MSPSQKEKRLFLVCHSQNCGLAKSTGIRCTISTMETMCEADFLNSRKLCVKYQSPASALCTPYWKISPDKPGERTLRKRKEKAERELVQDPDFLEIS